MSDQPPVFAAKNVSKEYQLSSGFVDRLLNREQTLDALDNVSFELRPSENLGIVGESGSGKSTLLETAAGLETPTSGTYYFRDDNMASFTKEDWKSFRKDAQIIFQDPYGTLNPRKTVFQSVAEPLNNFYDMTRSEQEEEVAETLSNVGLRPPMQFLDSFPNELSGGQRQRVNIARAIIVKPDIVFADEPLSMLDVSIQAGIIKLLRQLQDQLGFAMVYVSHNLHVVRLVCDKTAVMYRGEIVELGSSDQLMTDPKHPYTKALVASLPDLNRDRERVLLPAPIKDEPVNTEGCNFVDRCSEALEHCNARDPGLARAENRDIACYLYHDIDEKTT